MADQGVIDPPLDIEFEGMPAPGSFEKYADVQKWVQNELLAWNGLRKGEIDPPHQASIDQHFKRLKEMEDLSQKGIGAPSAQQAGAARGEIQSRLAHYNQGKAIAATSVLGRNILEIFKNDKSAGRGAFAIASHLPLNVPRANFDLRGTIVGAIELALMRDGLHSTIASERGALVALEKEFRDSLKKWNSALVKQRQFIATQQADTQEGISRLETLHNSQKGEFDELLEDSQRRLANREAHLKERLSTEAPVKYWNRKYWRGMWTAVIALVFITVVIGFASWGLWSNRNAVMDLFRLGTQGTFSLGPLLFVMLPTLGVAWVLRHLSRVFVTSYRNSNDANERATMVEVYLALISDETSEVGPEDRFLMLQALFRPGPDSSADDAPPPNLLEVLKGLRGKDQ